ncbi:MAG: tetratricopeptide repeat protein [Planctomycetes bacterium]|nr:tetratricopeptide repeat protein [Planctomycetota bacterium]
MSPPQFRLILGLSLGGFALAGAAGAAYLLLGKRSSSPMTAEQAFAQGEERFEARRFREAFSYFERAAKARPEDPHYQWAAGNAALRLGQSTVALPYIKSAWANGLKNAEVLLALVRASSGNRAERLRPNLDRLRELPDDPARRELEGDLHYAVADFPESLRLWNKLFEGSPSAGLANKIAVAYLSAGTPDRAEAFLKSCREKDFLDAEGYGLLASLAASRDHANEAKAVFAEGRARHGDSEDLRFNEAMFLLAQDRMPQAATLLDSLKDRAGDTNKEALHSQARITLGFIRAAQGDFAALDALAELAQGDGPWLEGERLYFRGLGERSAEWLRRAGALIGPHPALGWATARELARAKAWADAATAYRAIPGLIGRAPAVQIELAQTLRRAGKSDEAFAVLERLHARRFYSKVSLELYRDIAVEKKLSREAAEAQKFLERRYGDDPAILLAGGLLAFRAGNLAEAASVLDGLARQFPDRNDVEVARLSVLFASEEYESVLAAAAASRASPGVLAPFQAAALVKLDRASEALALYERTLSERREPGTMVAYANLLLSLDRSDDAATWYAEALRAQPENQVARLGLATLALRRRDWKTAREHAQAAAAGPPHAYTYILLAELDLEEGRPDRALSSSDRALGLAPDNDHARFLHGVAMLELGRAEEAEAILKRCAAAQPEATPVRWQLARAKMARGAIAEALEVVDSALTRGDPGDVSFQSMRMVLLARLGRIAEAKAALERISDRLSPARVIVCEAWMLLTEDRPAEAMERLASRLDDPDAAVYWAELTLLNGRPDGVIEALERHSLNAARWGRLGELARQQGFIAVAAACYRGALCSDPDNPQLLNNFAYASLQLDTFDEPAVLAAAKKACALIPDHPSVLHTYATALLRCGRERECINLLKTSAALTQRSAKLLYALASAYEKAGRLAQAVTSYEACRNHPDTAGVREGDLARPAIERRIERLRAELQAR